jgi:voltage-gated potassium channel
MHRKSIIFLSYFLILITIGSIGFYMIGGQEWSFTDSIYMTVITLSTVGFGEVHGLSEIGKIWTMIVIIFGVSGVAVMVSQLGEEILEFQQKRSKRLINKIKKMKDHYIICGFGKMGMIIANELDQLNEKFVVIDNDDSKAEELRELGYRYSKRDATLDETLMEVGAENAKGIVVTLGTDQDNLFVTMSARNLNPGAFLLSRCSNPDTEKKLYRAGANKVVNPYTAGGHRMVELLLAPYIEDAVTISSPRHELDMVIEKFQVNDMEFLDGKCINESRIHQKYNLMIVGVLEETGNMIINPAPNVLIKTGQALLLIGSKDQMRKFRRSLEH